MHPLCIYSIIIGLAMFIMAVLSYHSDKEIGYTDNSYLVFILSIGFIYLFFGILNMSSGNLNVIGKDWMSLCIFSSISIMSFTLQREKNLKKMSDDQIETKNLSAKSVRILNQIMLGLSLASIIIYSIASYMTSGDYSRVLNGIIFVAFIAEIIFITTRKDNAK